MAEAVLTQPHEIASERYVLGAMAQDADECRAVLDRLTAADFYEPRHQALFGAMAELAAARQPLDPHTISLQLEATRPGGGWFTAVLDLIEECYAPANAPYHVDVLRDRRVRRDLRLLCLQLGRGANDLSVAPDALLRQLRDALPGLEGGPGGAGFGAIAEWSVAELAAMEARDRGAGGGVPSGIAALDELTDGLMPQRLYCIAGYTGTGKSAIAQQLALNLAQRGVGVAYLSRELPNGEMLRRWIAMTSEGRLSYRLLERGLAGDADGPLRALRSRLVQQLHSLPLYTLYGRDTARIDQFERAFRRLHYEQGVSVFVVDYIQKLQGERERRRDTTRTEMLTDIADRCKDLTIECNSTGIILAQVDRGVLKDNRRPTTADLRESSGIAESSDVVVLLHAATRALVEEIPEKKREALRDVLADYAPLAVQLILDKGRALGSDSRWVYGFRPFGRMLSAPAPSRGRGCIGDGESTPAERAALYQWWRDFCDRHELERPGSRPMGLDEETETLLRLEADADKMPF